MSTDEIVSSKMSSLQRLHLLVDGFSHRLEPAKYTIQNNVTSMSSKQSRCSQAKHIYLYLYLSLFLSTYLYIHII